MLHATIRNGEVNGEVNGKVNGEVNGVINGVINGAINGVINLTPTEKKVLEEICKDPQITKVKLQNATNLGKGTVDRAIQSLRRKGIIDRVGSNKSGYWKVC